MKPTVSPRFWAGVRNCLLLDAVLLLLWAWACSPAHAQDASPFPRRYWTATAATAALAYSDAYSTEKLFQVRPQAYEGWSPWLYGHRPGAVREYSTITAEVALESLLAYKLRHHRGWWLPLGWSMAVHSAGAVNNFRLIRQDGGF